MYIFVYIINAPTIKMYVSNALLGTARGKQTFIYPDNLYRYQLFPSSALDPRLENMTSFLDITLNYSSVSTSRKIELQKC